MPNYYYINDFANQHGMGNRRKASCPVCGSRDNVSLDKGLGLVQCFTPGCSCRGILIDKDRPEGVPLGQASKEDLEEGIGKKEKGKIRGCEEERSEGEIEGTGKKEKGKIRGCEEERSEGDFDPQDYMGRYYPKSQEQVPVFPSDYKGLKTEVLARLWDLQSPPEGKDVETCVEAVRQYLQSIHISLTTAQHFGLKAYIHKFHDKDTGQKTTEGYSTHYSLCYPTMLQGRCVNLKARAVDVKAFTTEKVNKALPAVPFNIDSVEAILKGKKEKGEGKNEPLIFVEGEKDVLSLYEAGFACAVSVANGGGEDVRKVLRPFMPQIEQVGDIVICGDSDYAGRLMQMRLSYLFRDRARLAQLPPDCKDISEVLCLYGPERVQQVINEAKHLPAKNLQSPASLKEQIRQNLKGLFDQGYDTGYGPDFDRHLRFTQRGGLCVVTGYPGDGKSDFLFDLAAHLIHHQHKRFTFASLEQPDTADAMACVIRRLMGRADLSIFSDQDLDQQIDRLDHYMQCFDIEGGDPSVGDIIDACTRNLRLFPTDFLVVDNYARLRRDSVAEQNETEFVRQLLVALQDFGKRHHVWVLVVAHPRKPQDNNAAELADAASVSGSAHWFNLPDLGFTVKRELHDEQGIDYKVLNVWKVRDQRLCLPGRIYLLRQPCGRYEVRESKEAVESECITGVRYRDRGVWLESAGESKVESGERSVE